MAIIRVLDTRLDSVSIQYFTIGVRN